MSATNLQVALSDIKEERLQLLHLPIELLEEIIGYTNYDQIAHLRMVCRIFNRSCALLLNRGFIKVEKFHNQCQKKVKAQLPRRESERRNHPLARHSDVLSAIETRLSLLGMTYMKYVDMNLCCFIPGKVIDEIYKVLRFIQTNPNPPRVHELLQELRDISSMAMEFFEEKVAPNLKLKLASPANFLAAAVGVNMRNHQSQMLDFPAGPYRALASSSPSTSSLYSASTPVRNSTDREEEISKMKQYVKTCTSSLKKEVTSLKTRLKDSDKKNTELGQTVTDLAARVEELNQKLVGKETPLLPNQVSSSVNLKVAKVQQKEAKVIAVDGITSIEPRRSGRKRCQPDQLNIQHVSKKSKGY